MTPTNTNLCKTWAIVMQSSEYPYAFLSEIQAPHDHFLRLHT